MHQLMLPGMECIAAPSRLNATGERVLRVVLSLARRSGECFAFVATIARQARVAKRTAQKWLSIFRRMGLLDSKRRGRTSAVRVPTEPAPCSSTCASKPSCTTSHESRVKKPMVRDGARASALPNLTAKDLRDPERMQQLLAEAVAKTCPDRIGIVQDPCTLLRWFGCARRALRVGRNPGGLFRTLWNARRWGWISQADEDGARQDVRTVLHGPDQRVARAEAGDEWCEQ